MDGGLDGLLLDIRAVRRRRASVDTGPQHARRRSTPAPAQATTSDAAPVPWLPHSPRCRYRIDVKPLDYSNAFTTAEDLQDFVLTPATPEHSIAVNSVTGTLDIVYSANSWQNASTSGRGLTPYAIRRVPDGAAVELNAIDCSARPAGATTALCGFVAYDAGANVPLFTWMVGYSAPFGG